LRRQAENLWRRLMALRFARDLAKTLPADIYPYEAIEGNSQRLSALWAAFWATALDSFAPPMKKQDDEEDELEGGKRAIVSWMREKEEKARKEYGAAWLAAAIAAYTAAIGIEAREKEKKAMRLRAEREAARQMAETRQKMRQMMAALEMQVLAAPSLEASADMAVRGIMQAAAFFDPSVNARASLAAFVEDALAEAARETKPLAAFRELHRGMDFQVRRVVGLYNEGKASAEEWRARMKEIFADNYREAYRLGKLRAGGHYALTAADRAELRRLVVDENKFLAKWIRDARTKYLALPEETARARMLWRGGLYADALQGVFNAGWLSALGAEEEILWVMNPLAEHCETCLEESAKGWRRRSDLTRVPGDGSTICITTPESRILTARGLIPMADITLGDLVWTHKSRWRPVVELHLTFANAHKQAWIKTHWGSPIGCTAEHQWLTPEGWQSIKDIDKKRLPMYAIGYGKDMPPLRQENANRPDRGILQRMRRSLSLRPKERFSGEGMPELRDVAEGEGPMASHAPDYAERIENGRAKAPEKIGRFDIGVISLCENRWPTLRLLLERQRAQGVHIPVSVGLDKSARADSTRICDSPLERRPHRRPIGKPGDATAFGAQRVSYDRRTEKSDARAERVAIWKSAGRLLQNLRGGIQGESQDKGKSVLFRGMLSPLATPIKFAQFLSDGTPLYDIGVAEDHSFVIEGFLSHNCRTNCRCHLVSRAHPRTASVIPTPPSPFAPMPQKEAKV